MADVSLPSHTPDAPARPRRPLRILLPLAVLVVAAAAYVGAQRLAPGAGDGVALGTLDAVEVAVASEVTARVTAVLAREGDAVRAGAPLVRLDDAVVRVQMAQAPAAEQQVLALQQAKYTIGAPLTGTVLRRSIEPGEVAVAGAPLLTIADMQQLEMKVYVLQRDLALVRVGDPAMVQADALPGETFPGTVTWVAGQAEFTPRNVQTAKDRANLVFAVKVRVERPDGRLKPGMSASVRFAR